MEEAVGGHEGVEDPALLLAGLDRVGQEAEGGNPEGLGPRIAGAQGEADPGGRDIAGPPRGGIGREGEMGGQTPLEAETAAPVEGVAAEVGGGRQLGDRSGPGFGEEAVDDVAGPLDKRAGAPIKGTRDGRHGAEKDPAAGPLRGAGEVEPLEGAPLESLPVLPVKVPLAAGGDLERVGVDVRVGVEVQLDLGDPKPGPAGDQDGAAEEGGGNGAEVGRALEGAQQRAQDVHR